MGRFDYSNFTDDDKQEGLNDIQKEQAFKIYEKAIKKVIARIYALEQGYPNEEELKKMHLKEGTD